MFNPKQLKKFPSKPKKNDKIAKQLEALKRMKK